MSESDRSIEELGFEEALEELEQMLDRFERAMALRAHCAALLSDAETRIEQLVNEEGATEPFSMRPSAGDTDADQA